MTSKVPSITSMKSNKSTLLKKALVITAAVTGLLIAGAVVFASTLPDEVEVDVTE